jgi:hypothetical protein
VSRAGAGLLVASVSNLKPRHSLALDDDLTVLRAQFAHLRSIEEIAAKADSDNGEINV